MRCNTSAVQSGPFINLVNYICYMKLRIITLLPLALRRTNALALNKSVLRSLQNPRVLRLVKPGGSRVMAMAATTSTSSLCSGTTSTIASYLESIAANFPVSDGTKVNIIMGNEAGDADSIVSSLALSQVNKIISDKNANASADSCTTSSTTSSTTSETLSLPLASIQRNDLPLRRDVVLLLQMAAINSEKIVYLDDDTFTSVAQNKDIQKEITLVDHNKIRSDLAELLQDHVVEILDHHQDEGAHGSSVTTDRRKIAFQDQVALVGSTCTLITERLMEIGFGLDESEKLDAGLGVMLLGVILLDTMNMSKEAAKGTARDERAIEFLMEQTEWGALPIDNDDIKSKIYGNDCILDGGQPPSRSHLYEYLRDSKFDKSFWESMSPRDALRIDYKRFEPPTGACDTFGLSSVLLSMEKLVAKKEFYQDAMDYMEEANVDLLGVLTMVIVDDTPQRELLLVGNTDRVRNMTEFLLNDEAAAQLKIESILVSEVDVFISVGDGLSVSKLKQGNPKGSRKQVAPLMMAMHQK